MYVNCIDRMEHVCDCTNSSYYMLCLSVIGKSTEDVERRLHKLKLLTNRKKRKSKLENTL